MTKNQKRQLADLLAATGKELAVSRHLRIENVDEPETWMASIPSVEISEGCILKSVVGWGPTPDKAISDMLGTVNGKLLVLDAYRNCRREILFRHS
jgi:hypothetical protein